MWYSPARRLSAANPGCVSIFGIAYNSLIEASGGSTIYNTSEIQRIWRDINGVCGHVGFNWDSTMTSAGRFELGLTASSFNRFTK